MPPVLRQKGIRSLARRIGRRAIRRCGELLREIEPANGANQNIGDGGAPKVTRTGTAVKAGLSERQQKTALRVANAPKEEFEAAIEIEPCVASNLIQNRRDGTVPPVHVPISNLRSSPTLGPPGPVKRARANGRTVVSRRHAGSDKTALSRWHQCGAPNVMARLAIIAFTG